MTETADSGPDLAAELKACRAEVARLHLMLDVQSTIDLPTGLFNAQGMLDPLRGAMDRLARTDEPFAVVVIDLPGVASASEAVRDSAMRHAGAIVSATIRSLDRIGRIGDAALMLVLPQVGAAGVQIVLERIDRALGVLSIDEGESISLESAFTVALSAAEPLDVDAVLGAIDAGRQEASVGSPSIIQL